MMTDETKDRLKQIPKTRCYICNTPRTYTNPMAKCIKCGKKFCYDHISAKVGKKDVEDWCDKCIKG